MERKRLKKISKKLSQRDNLEEEQVVELLNELQNAPVESVHNYGLFSTVKALRKEGGNVRAISKALVRSWKNTANEGDVAQTDTTENDVTESPGRGSKKRKRQDSDAASTAISDAASTNVKSNAESDVALSNEESDIGADSGYSEMKVAYEPKGSTNPPLVTFANGVLKDHSKVKFSYYTSQSKKQFVVCEGSNLVYRNDDSNSFEKFQTSIGIRDRETGVLQIVCVRKYNMFPDMLVRQPLATDDSISDRQANRTERIKMFGSRKANTALNRREKNIAIPKNIDPAKDVLSDEDDDEVESENKDDEEEGKANSMDDILPPINTDAVHKEDVYSLNALIPESDWDGLQEPAEALYKTVTDEEDVSWKQHFTYNVKSALEGNVTVDSIRSILYLHYMIQLSVWKAAELKKQLRPGFIPFQTGNPWDPPPSVGRSLVNFFTSADARGKRLRSKTDKDKLCCYMFALALHTEKNDFIVNVDRLKSDAQIPKNRILPLAKLMQLKYDANSGTLELKLPLPAKEYPKAIVRKKR